MFAISTLVIFGISMDSVFLGDIDAGLTLTVLAGVAEWGNAGGS